MQRDPKYWFPAKSHGWGWGAPVAWQGWAVMAVFLSLVAAGVVIFPPATRLLAYLAFTTAMTGLLIGVCWFKGEPPRWRWGTDGDQSQ